MPVLRIAQNLPSANFFLFDILAPLRKKFSFPAKFNILIFNVSKAGYVVEHVLSNALLNRAMHCSGTIPSI